LTQNPDPASGQPFVYRQTATGFELEAAYQQKGKSVVLRFPSNGCLIETFMLHSAHLAEILADDARPTHFLPLSEPLMRTEREK
jgi:hypothetical protein